MGALRISTFSPRHADDDWPYLQSEFEDICHELERLRFEERRKPAAAPREKGAVSQICATQVTQIVSYLEATKVTSLTSASTTTMRWMQ